MSIEMRFLFVKWYIGTDFKIKKWLDSDLTYGKIIMVMSIYSARPIFLLRQSLESGAFF
jgi:hypothetical protein